MNLPACAQAINLFFEAKTTEIWMPGERDTVRLVASSPEPTDSAQVVDPLQEDPQIPSPERMIQLINEVWSPRPEDSLFLPSRFFMMRDEKRLVGTVRVIDPRACDSEEIHYVQDLVDMIAAVLRKRRALDAIVRSEEKFAMVMNLVPDGIFLAE